MKRRRRKTGHREPTIALINIVFLMLVFFLVAGTIARPLDPTLALVRTADLEGAAPADALVAHPDGRLSYRGEVMASASAWVDALEYAERETLRIVPDRDLPARSLVDLGRELQQAGAGRVVVVTQQGLE